MRLLGIARHGNNTFCSLMDLCIGFHKNSYAKIIDHIYAAAKLSFDRSVNNAVDDEVKKVENGRLEKNLKVSGDGTWKKREFKSLYSVTTLIGYYSGKVHDLVVKSSCCSGCTFWKNKTYTKEYEEWLEDHEENCSKNHEGSAGKMEVDSMVEMFTKSEEKFSVKYGNYIGDGDSKTFKAILELNPYGDKLTVVKNECIGHVQKRMGTRLRNLR